VVLRKSLSGLGFSFNISQLWSGPDRGSVVRIKRLFPGQPALESGLLRQGDVILSVNKEPVKDLSYQVKGLGHLNSINPILNIKQANYEAHLVVAYIGGFLVSFFQH